MLKAVIFDMDGLLIDSESFWKISEKKIFSQLGLNLTQDMMSQTVGLMVRDVVDYWFQRFPWDIVKYPKQAIAEEIVDNVTILIREQGTGKKGYSNAIRFFHQNGWKIGLNSASDYRLIETVLDVLDIREYFEVIHSGQEEEYGKPHPGGYIHTAEKLGVHPSDCLVFEDSLNGVLSAKSARMKCVAVPEEHNIGNQRFSIADSIIRSLDQFDKEKLQQLTL